MRTNVEERRMLMTTPSFIVETFYLYYMTFSDKDIKTIKDYFTDKPVLKAFLFDSYSQEEATTKSDVDILVELKYSQPVGMSFLSMEFEPEERLQK